MMWELIRQNRRRSMVLFALMAVVLVLLGFAIGATFDPEWGGPFGIAVAVAIWLGMTGLTLTSGDDILLKVTGAREVTKDVHPRLFNVVEEMKIAAGLPAMPRVYIIDEPAPNAFAIGLKPEKAAVAVTAGLLSRLNRDELQGVVAHEVAHILNRDSQLMTVAGIMLGSIVLISNAFMRSWWFWPSGSRRYRKPDSGGSPQLQLIMLAAAILLAVLGPIMARLMYLGISRKREYLADATAVQLTRYPEGLASALEKISSVKVPLEAANQVTAPMFIASPYMKKESRLSGLGSTHPPMEERIKILRFMSKGAGFFTYQKAFSRAKGKPTDLIPVSYLDERERIDIRQPSVEPDPPKDTKAQTREAMDLMRAINEYAFLVCACGLKMKLPPDYPEKSFDCPRCSREIKVPHAHLAAAIGAAVGATAATGAAGEQAEPEQAQPSALGDGDQVLEYTRKGRQWETFACSCGQYMQLSPAFRGAQMQCRNCGRFTLIKQ